jgi:hypothetical protein
MKAHALPHPGRVIPAVYSLTSGKYKFPYNLLSVYVLVLVQYKCNFSVSVYCDPIITVS